MASEGLMEEDTPIGVYDPMISNGQNEGKLIREVGTSVISKQSGRRLIGQAL